jgi:hypothetical protein
MNTLRTTIAVDAVGRVLRKAGTLTWAPSDFGSEFMEFSFNSDQDLHLVLGSVGLKVNPFRNMPITANVLFPLTKHGLTDKLTWMAGVDYLFCRRRGYRFSSTDSTVQMPSDRFNLKTLGIRRGAGRVPTLGSIDTSRTHVTTAVSPLTEI